MERRCCDFERVRLRPLAKLFALPVEADEKFPADALDFRLGLCAGADDELRCAFFANSRNGISTARHLSVDGLLVAVAGVVVGVLIVLAAVV